MRSNMIYNRFTMLLKKHRAPVLTITGQPNGKIFTNRFADYVHGCTRHAKTRVTHNVINRPTAEPKRLGEMSGYNKRNPVHPDDRVQCHVIIGVLQKHRRGLYARVKEKKSLRNGRARARLQMTTAVAIHRWRFTEIQPIQVPPTYRRV